MLTTKLNELKLLRQNEARLSREAVERHNSRPGMRREIAQIATPSSNELDLRHPNQNRTALGISQAYQERVNLLDQSISDYQKLVNHYQSLISKAEKLNQNYQARISIQEDISNMVEAIAALDTLTETFSILEAHQRLRNVGITVERPKPHRIQDYEFTNDRVLEKIQSYEFMVERLSDGSCQQSETIVNQDRVNGRISPSSDTSSTTTTTRQGALSEGNN